jgi:alpha/beta superfamily hydrolase
MRDPEARSLTDVNAGEDPRGIAVLLHPHPDFGGDRFHPFIETMFRRLPDVGLAALRFDFSCADPLTAHNQVVAAIDTGTASWPGRPLVLVGYSFGAGVACGIADIRVGGWYLLAPPSGALSDAVIGPDPRPKAIAVPEYDQFSPPAVIAKQVAGWVATTVTVVANADHFLGPVNSIVDNALNWAVTLTRSH